MGFPYSSGDVLTAADLNQSSGLVLVKTQTVGTSVPTVTITGITGFDVYQFVFDSIDASSGVLIIIDDFTNLTSSLWNATTLLWSGSGTPTVYTNTNSADAFFGLVDTKKSASTLTVYNPNQAGRTRFHAMSQYSSGIVISGGYYNADTTTDTLTFKTSSGTFTGGKILVYGMNWGA
jgi:hypothetical protein